MSRRVVGLVAMFAALWSVSAWSESGPRDGQFYVSLLGAYYEPPNDLDLDETTGWGGGIGWAFHDRWSFEVLYFDLSPDVENGPGDADQDTLWGNFLYRIPVESEWQPYATVGFGRSEWGGDFRNESDNQANAGIGLFGNLGDRVAVRGDLRAVYHNNDNDITPFASIGLTLFLGAVPKAAVDSDGDGVLDGSDRCPGTPAGRVVDVNGCELDSDGDGVVDGVDACPNTPAGVAVDSRGCPLDSDGDGVTDDKDECPNTPRGTRVDDRGCPEVVEEPVTFNLTVEFAFDSAEINEIGVQELFRAIRFLREHPSTDAVVEGHTDSRGDEAYNQGLSERRAGAVRQAIVNSGIDASRLTVRGFGESRPAATNDTEDGRQQNRRVTIVVDESSR